MHGTGSTRHVRRCEQTRPRTLVALRTRLTALHSLHRTLVTLRLPWAPPNPCCAYTSARTQHCITLRHTCCTVLPVISPLSRSDVNQGLLTVVTSTVATFTAYHIPDANVTFPPAHILALVVYAPSLHSHRQSLHDPALHGPVLHGPAVHGPA
jgi:hypothetical protein